MGPIEDDIDMRIIMRQIIWVSCTVPTIRKFFFGTVQSNRASILGSVFCFCQCFKLPLISENAVALINDQLEGFGNASDISKMLGDIRILSLSLMKYGIFEMLLK